MLQSLKDRSLSEDWERKSINNQYVCHQGVPVCVCVLTVVLGVAQTQSQVVHVLQDLFQGQLGQFTAGAAQTEDRDKAAYSWTGPGAPTPGPQILTSDRLTFLV